MKIFNRVLLPCAMSLALLPLTSAQAADSAPAQSQSLLTSTFNFWDWGWGWNPGDFWGHDPVDQYPAACKGQTFPTKDRNCLIALAQQGGYVLYTRHVRTDTDFADQDDKNFDINNCNQQRKVSSEGWVQAAVLGKAIKQFDIHVESVTSSQFCRAWQSAIPMYGHLDQKSDRLNFIQEASCAGEAQLQTCLDRKAKQNVTPLLSKRVRGWGENRALVAHDDPFKSTTGYYPFPMGATYIIKPKGMYEGFEVLGCIAPDGWFGETPKYSCNLDASLTADDFNEGVPDGTPLPK